MLKSLDREDEKTINLKVAAECVGSGKCRSVTDVQIHLSDINDNPPVFNQSLYKFNVSESAREGSSISTVASLWIHDSKNEKKN